MGAEEDLRATAADPGFQAAVLRALHGDVTDLAGMDPDTLRYAARSLTVLIAGRLVAAAPCTLGGADFWVDAGVVTFAAEGGRQLDQLAVTAARLISVDATALLRRDHGLPTQELWLDLWGAVPPTFHRSLAYLIAGKFTTTPRPLGGPHD